MISVVCISLVDRSNQPLLFRSFENEFQESMQFSIYSALDLLERKTNDDSAEGSLDTYLGYLGPAITSNYEYEIYGFLSFSQVKIIAILQDHPENESELRDFFQNIYKLYVDTLCNPFLLRTIETPKLLSKIDELLFKVREQNINIERN
ncbi:hypothetical protein RS030_111861 [Cryptosporidium xiaoi]|uniref:Trafficking protein particle complex subunit n=1 Tax=Cryptosporidium xiaoi TaxID=659607 RepID=A0AAV9Y3D4_9CRYT